MSTTSDLGVVTHAARPHLGADVASLLGDLVREVRPSDDAQLTALTWEMLTQGGEEPARLEATVVRRGATAGHHPLVVQAFALSGAQARPLALGSATWHLAGPLAPAAARSLRRGDLCSAEWGAAMLERLNSDRQFSEVTHSFDGSIEIVAGDRQLQFRIYRGRVLETTRKTPNGATFSVAGSDLAWTRLITAERNDFISRASTGEFGSRGSSFQYLRMIKAVVLMAGHARTLWREEQDARRALP